MTTETASMRPRLIAVDDHSPQSTQARRPAASMRPRLIAVDDEVAAALTVDPHFASMRPRLIAVDDAGNQATATLAARLQ